MGRRGRRPLHRQRSLRLLEFYYNKIHRLLRGVSSSQKISGTTLIFREPYIFAYVTFVIHIKNIKYLHCRPGAADGTGLRAFNS